MSDGGIKLLSGLARMDDCIPRFHFVIRQPEDLGAMRMMKLVL